MKKNTRAINGILILDKPSAMSSNHALQTVKRLFQAKKAGHTGCLDPLATGVLPICFGDATKFSQYALDADKAYETVASLGQVTSTGDSEGEVTAQFAIPELSAENIEAVLHQFRGDIAQVPPMFSALKVNGQTLYKLARKGIEVERKARLVHIHELNLLEQTANRFRLRVRCSKGTYIRSLVQDIGHQLGCGAHVSELRRTVAGQFSLADSYTLAQLQAMGAEELDDILLPVDSFLGAMPKLNLNQEQRQLLYFGQVLDLTQAAQPPAIYRLYDQTQQFIGLGQLDRQQQLRAMRLCAQIL